jgi:hypothetical protein
LLIPLRVGLVSPDAQVAFNISIKVLYPPHIGDKIVLDEHLLRVTEVFHFPAEEPAALWRTASLAFDDADKFYRALDFFKSKFEIADLAADNERTDTHYTFFRKVVNLLGLQQTHNPYLEREDKDGLRLFAEAVRAVLMAEFEDDFETGYTNYNGAIENLLQTVIERKRDPKAKLEMYHIIKTWELVLNHSGKTKWTAPLEKCRAAARTTFARLRSIPLDRLPVLEETT